MTDPFADLREVLRRWGVGLAAYIEEGRRRGTIPTRRA